MSLFKVTIMIISVVATEASTDGNRTVCSDVSLSKDGTKSCVQRCSSRDNSSCEMSCMADTQKNITGCVQSCIFGNEHKSCKAKCVASAGNCEQKLDNGAAACSAKACSQYCEVASFPRKCSLDCSGYRCYQLCYEQGQCTLSCNATVEICHQEIFVSSRPKRAVCNSTHCLQRCDRQTTCECGGTHCRQECYHDGCNMTCHRGVKVCTQYCLHGNCGMTCFAEKCNTITTYPTQSTSSLPMTAAIETTTTTTSTLEQQVTSDVLTSTAIEFPSSESVQTPTSEGVETTSKSSVLQLKIGSQKECNTILLSLVIPLLIIIFMLFILLGCLVHRLKKQKSSANITDEVPLPSEQKEETVQMVPLMEETSNTKTDIC